MSYLFLLKENLYSFMGREAFLSKLLFLHSENGNNLLSFTVESVPEGSCKVMKTWWHKANSSEALRLEPTSGRFMGAIVSLLLTTVDSRYLEFQGTPWKLRDIRTSTYQICRIEEKIIRFTTFNKFICNWTLEVKIYWKYCGKEEKLLLLWQRGEIAP